MGLFSSQGRNGTGVDGWCTRIEVGNGASDPRGAGPKVCAPGDLKVGIRVAMGPSAAGGSKVEGITFVGA